MMPYRRPRMIATDLDGTIIGYEHTRSGFITPRTVEAFQNAHDEGIQVVFVTGRPMRWLAPLEDALGHAGPVICSNGAVVYDMADHTVMESRPMALETVLQARDLIAALDSGAAFGAETLSGFHLESRFVDRSRAHPGEDRAWAYEVGSTLEEVLPDRPEVVKFLAKTRAQDPDAFLGEVRELLGDLLAVTHSAPGIALLEMSRPDVNKASTLEDFAASHGIRATEVMAFGDMPNDLEMIRWAGTGVAVGSGHPTLLAEADLVAGACDDDGVAAVIEQVLTLD